MASDTNDRDEPGEYRKFCVRAAGSVGFAFSSALYVNLWMYGFDSLTPAIPLIVLVAFLLYGELAGRVGPLPRTT